MTTKTATKTSIKTSTSKKTYTSKAAAFRAAARQHTPAGVNVVKIARGTYIVASTPWAYRLQQQGRGTVVSA